MGRINEHGGWEPDGHYGEAFQIKLSEIGSDIYLIQKGVRNCCLHCSNYLNDEHDRKMASEIISYVKWSLTDIEKCFGMKIHYLVRERHTEDEEKFLDIFIYRYKHQRWMFNAVQRLRGWRNNHEYVLSEYVLGKLLGYSDEDMDNYICRIVKEMKPNVQSDDG